MALLTREAFLQLRLRHEDVEVPEWGGHVRLWELSALRKLDLQPAEGEAPEKAMVRLVAACIGDADGPAGLPVENLSAAILHRLLDVATRLNAATREDAEKQQGNS